MGRIRMPAMPLICAAVIMQVACGPSPAGSGSGIVLGPGTGPHALAISGDSLDKLARNPLVWSGSDTALRRCTAGASCLASGGRVRVVVSADTSARNTAPSVQSGQILIGKLENLGRAQEQMYGLKPGPFYYLVFVVPGGTADTGRFILEQVSKIPPYEHRTVASGPFVGCKHTNTWTKSFADFRSCEDGPPTESMSSSRQPGGIRTAGVANFFGWLGFLQPELEDPAWWTCTSGCCTAGHAALGLD